MLLTFLLGINSKIGANLEKYGNQLKCDIKFKLNK